MRDNRWLVYALCLTAVLGLLGYATAILSTTLDMLFNISLVLTAILIIAAILDRDE